MHTATTTYKAFSQNSLGRFLSPDPYGQFYSAYTGMGNNPVNLIDPSGGITGGWSIQTAEWVPSYPRFGDGPYGYSEYYEIFVSIDFGPGPQNHDVGSQAPSTGSGGSGSAKSTPSGHRNGEHYSNEGGGYTLNFYGLDTSSHPDEHTTNSEGNPPRDIEEIARELANDLTNLVLVKEYVDALRNNDGVSSGDNRGQVISVANGAVAAGPIGAMADIGGVIDSNGDSKLYLTIGWAIGFGATAGVGYSKTNPNMDISDFSGRAAGLNLTLRNTPLSFEGYRDLSHGAERDYYGDKLRGNGGNIGVGKGWFAYISYTLTFDPPSRDIWLHPAMRR